MSRKALERPSEEQTTKAVAPRDSRVMGKPARAGRKSEEGVRREQRLRGVQRSPGTGSGPQMKHLPLPRRPSLFQSPEAKFLFLAPGERRVTMATCRFHPMKWFAEESADQFRAERSLASGERLPEAAVVAEPERAGQKPVAARSPEPAESFRAEQSRAAGELLEERALPKAEQPRAVALNRGAGPFARAARGRSPAVGPFREAERSAPEGQVERNNLVRAGEGVVRSGQVGPLREGQPFPEALSGRGPSGAYLGHIPDTHRGEAAWLRRMDFHRGTPA